MAADRIRVVCGPTAAGKSAMAMTLASHYGAAIVSADSRQVYRGFDVGTAKPTADERRRVPHFGLDVAEPTERYSAARWADGATQWIATARAMGREPLIVGGTGFYLRALFEPLFHAPPLDGARRAMLERHLADFSVAELRRWCEALDPERAHLGRTQLLRAIETALLVGKRVSALHREAARPARFAARYLVVDPGPSLAVRIASRLDEMLASGWIEEVGRLDAAVPTDAPAWNATGYRSVRRLVRGETDVVTAREAILIETRQYAKRQRTWFRHQLPTCDVTLIDPARTDADARIHDWWDGGDGA